MVSLLVSFIVWQDFDPRLIIFFVGSVAISEMFIVVRWRFSIACRRCGFDPVLYKKDRAAAASRVKDFYRERMEDPMSVFSPPPKLPMLIRKKA